MGTFAGDLLDTKTWAYHRDKIGSDGNAVVNRHFSFSTRFQHSNIRHRATAVKGGKGTTCIVGLLENSTWYDGGMSCPKNCKPWGNLGLPTSTGCWLVDFLIISIYFWRFLNQIASEWWDC